MAIEAGQQLLHYRLIEKIGEGGMGVVWKAVDSTLDREVAIKILPDGFAANPERLSRFEREAKLLASLNHPNIAGIYGIHKASDSGPFLAMEMVEGEDLAERLNRGALPTDEALRIALEIARAFEAAHESGVIHRDLKPANVRLTPEGQVKVLDFGLAKALSPEASGPGGNPSISPTLTSTGTVAGMILGTAAYMSPEQAKGKRVDRRADIWSFGVVLFELLSGRMLFAGETISETLAAVILKEIDLEGLPADVSPAIRVLLERCLRRDPTARLRDIGDARIAIEEVLDGRVPELAPRGEAAPSVAGSRKGERLVWLTVVALLVAIGMWSWLTPSETNRSDEDWRLSIARTRDANGEFFAISPDGSTLAYSGEAGVYLRPLNQLDPVLIKDTEYGYWPFWSPDSRHLGFIQDGKLKRVAVATGQIEFIAEMPNPRAPGSWLADGQILFQARYKGALLSVSADGSSPPVPVTNQDDRLGGDAGHRWAAPLPDGKRFVFVEHDYFTLTSAIRVGSFDSPDSRVILPARPVNIGFLSVCDGYLLYKSDDALLAHPFDAERAEFTGDPRRLLDGARVASAVVSKNGVLAWVPARDTENDASLAWFDRRGTLLGEIPDLPQRSASPRLSPDGKRVLFHGRSKDLDDINTLFIYDIERSTVSRLVSSYSLMGIWSPDGKQVAYLGGEGFSIVETTGAAIPRVIKSPEDGYRGLIPSGWSLDGRYIAIDVENVEGFDLAILHVDNGELVPFMEGGNYAPFYASFAPDGKWIAYTSDESGRNEVYIESFPDRGKRTRVSTRGGIYPRWRRDGRELFFVVENNDKLWMFGGSALVEFHAVDIEQVDGELRPGTPTLLFEARAHIWNHYYDVTADGKRFIIGITPERPARPIHVLSDWRSELEE